MKIITIAFLSLFATAAFACPDLSGTYQCKKDDQDPNDSGIMTLTKTEADGTTVYIMTDKETPNEQSMLPTDGQTYEDGESSYTGSCSGENFNVVLTGVHADVGAYVVNMTYKLDSAKNLSNTGVIKFKYQGQPQQQTFSDNCTRL